MIKIFGTPKNIEKPLMGRISFCPVKKKDRVNTIIVNPRMSKRGITDYLAIISSDRASREKGETGLRILCNATDVDLLFDGDIVELLPDGCLNVLYQANSKHNVLFVTSRCNCKCLMCPQPPVGNGEEGLLDHNLKLISLIPKSTEELAITGGEPTLIGEDLFRLILACKSLLPETSLLLLTNGRKFSDYKFTKFLSSLKHPNLTIGIGLYGNNSMEHDFIMGAKGAFNQTIRGILNLARFENPIEIRIVIHRYTYRQLPRISEFIYRNLTFVRHVAFMGLETIGNARKNLESLWVEPTEVVNPLKESIHYLARRAIKTSIYNIPLCLLPESLWSYARQSISDWKNAYDSKCVRCEVINRCSGLFDSGADIFGDFLRPLKFSPPE